MDELLRDVGAAGNQLTRHQNPEREMRYMRERIEALEAINRTLDQEVVDIDDDRKQLERRLRDLRRRPPGHPRSPERHEHRGVLERKTRRVEFEDSSQERQHSSRSELGETTDIELRGKILDLRADV